MKRIIPIMVVFLLFGSFTYAQDRAQVNLVARVKHLISLNLNQSQNANGYVFDLEASNNSIYANEKQKFYVTDSNQNKIEVKSKTINDNSGKVHHQVIISYMSELARENRPLVFNIVAN